MPLVLKLRLSLHAAYRSSLSGSTAALMMEKKRQLSPARGGLFGWKALDTSVGVDHVTPPLVDLVSCTVPTCPPPQFCIMKLYTVPSLPITGYVYSVLGPPILCRAVQVSPPSVECCSTTLAAPGAYIMYIRR